MGGDKLLSSAEAPTSGSPTSPDRKLLRHPILASLYTRKKPLIQRLVATPLQQFKTHLYIDNSSL